jgi:multidrug efflux pump subunit AcrA (membrane-fusion protein)
VTEEATLYTIADLSQVWVQALVIESDVSAVRVGMPVEVSSVSYPGEIFYGTVNFISPTVNPENRSVRVRVVVDNAAGKLKPGMYVTTVVRSPIGQYGPAGSIPMGEPKPVTLDAKTTTAVATATPEPLKLPTQSPADAERFLVTLAVGASYFTCPMHPEVVSDQAGDCPKCGMHLTAKQKEEKRP